MNDVSIVALDVVRLALAAALGAGGAIFILLGVLGLLRFPDLFSRTHAFGVISGLGAGLILLALALTGWELAIVLRLAVLGVVLGLAGPLIAHLTAGAAHAAGLAPISGAYTAPRPGASARRDPVQP